MLTSVFTLPAGIIVPFAGSTVPTGWLICDGSSYSQTTYSTLYSAIGSTWNTFRSQSSPGAGNFRVPLLNGVTLVGSGSAVSTGSPVTSSRTLGQSFGEETHTLINAEVPATSVTTLIPVDTESATGPDNSWDGVSLMGGKDSGDNSLSPRGQVDGSNGSHNNIQPSAVIKWIIKT